MMGWIITLVILFLLAILPLGADVRYNSEGLSLKVIAGPIRIGILPSKRINRKKIRKKNQSPRKKRKQRLKESRKVRKSPRKRAAPLPIFCPW